MVQLKQSFKTYHYYNFYDILDNIFSKAQS